MPSPLDDWLRDTKAWFMRKAYSGQGVHPYPGAFAENRVSQTPTMVHPISADAAGTYRDNDVPSELVEDELRYGPPRDDATIDALLALRDDWKTKPRGVINLAPDSANHRNTVLHETMHAIEDPALKHVDRRQHMLYGDAPEDVRKMVSHYYNSPWMGSEALAYASESPTQPDNWKYLQGVRRLIQDDRLRKQYDVLLKHTKQNEVERYSGNQRYYDYGVE